MALRPAELRGLNERFAVASGMHTRIAAVALATLFTAGAGEAADRRVRLSVPPDLTKDLPAFPLIADPADEAERRINAALRRLDASGVKAAKECKADTKGQGSFERGIDATMRGPRFLSFSINDSAFCGGAHPSYGTMAIVYDLTTGSPVDWTSLLPAVLTGTLALQEGSDGTKMVTLASKRLHALYLERYRPKTGNPKMDDADKECREAVAETWDGKPPAMMAWLDAKEGGLAVHFDLAHAVQACADAVVIPAATLRKEGASAVLVDAIEAAKAGR